MTERELQERLKSALDHAAPDDLDAVLSRCGAEKGNVIDLNGTTAARRRKRPRARSLIAACLALALLGGGGGAFYQRAYAVASVVSLDVNPSIELKVNRSEKVLSCAGLNAEAAAVLADMDGGRDLKGAKLDVAVNAIVGALVRNGYLDRLDSAILISVEDRDTARGARLQQELVASVDGVLQSAENTASVLSQNVAADAGLNSRAQKNNISTGKAHLIDRTLALNGDLSFDELAALSVEELRDLLQTGAPGMPIGQDAALRAALDFAGLSETDCTAYEVDPELDERTPCYEVELFVNGRETEYGVDAYTSQVIRGEPLPAVTAPALPRSDTPAVTEADAEALALADAGLQDADAITTRSDYDDGRLRYEVTFFAGGCAYEYEIDAATGTIVGSDRDRDPRAAQTVSTPEPTGDVGGDAAVAAALDHAGLAEGQVSRLKCEQDRDDGRIEYEIEFTCDGYEYEYTIDAATGAILDHERDWDD